jgi:glycosyltransferase involved in cell wall biosynthesis
LAQTHPAHEIIVIDDGSTDSTVKLVEQYGSSVRLIRQENTGPAAARNQGVRAAIGTWVAFLDSDDVWMPDKLQRQLARAKATGAIFVYTDRENCGQCTGTSRYGSDAVSLPEGEVYEQLLQGNFITLSGVMMRRDLFLQSGGFCESLRTVEDWDLWLRIAAQHEVALCPDPLVRYRIHPDGISRSVSLMEKNIFTVLDLALSSDRGRTVSRRTVRQAMASAWSALGWSASATSPFRAVPYYFHSLLTDPLNYSTFKQFLKSCLGRA